MGKKKTTPATVIIADLTIENAPMVSTIISRNNPEWGVQRFQFDNIYGHHTRDNSSVLFEGDFKFWGVVSFK